MKISLKLGFNKNVQAQPPVILAVSTINPFSATVTPPQGYEVIAGPILISVTANPGTYGTTQTIAGTITGGLTGIVTENIAGSLKAALALAGWLDGQTPMISLTVQIDTATIAIIMGSLDFSKLENSGLIAVLGV